MKDIVRFKSLSETFSHMAELKEDEITSEVYIGRGTGLHGEGIKMVEEEYHIHIISESDNLRSGLKYLVKGTKENVEKFKFAAASC
jgi:hypothetical protein